MPDTQQEPTYGQEYYAKHCGSIPYDRNHTHWSVFFGGIADELIRSYKPTRVFDAGCAHGFLVEAFWDRGVEAWGRDISAFAIAQVRADIKNFCSVGSISDPIIGQFDLVTCIEVLEHIPEEDAIRAITCITSVTDRVVFSSSPTDLTEPTHINVKPPIYWLRLFGAQGFAPVMGENLTFLTPHAMVLERSEIGRRDQDLFACAEMVRTRLQVADRDQTIRNLYAITAERDRSLQDARHQLDERDRSLQDARHQLDERDRSLQDARHQLDERDRSLQDALQQLDERDRSLQDALQQLDERDRSLQDARHQLDERDRLIEVARIEFASLRMSLDNVRSEAVHLRAIHNSVISSSAWRMTFPIRSLGHRLPPLFRRRIRQSLKLIWWGVTLQIGSRIRERHANAKSRQQPAQALLPGDQQVASRDAIGADEPSPSHSFNEHLEAAWYLSQNPDVSAAAIDAVQHYQTLGKTQGRRWGLPQDVTRQATWYLQLNPDVAEMGLDPLEHFLRNGSKEGRAWPRIQPTAAEVAADQLPWVRLLNICVDPNLADQPKLNVMVPTLALRGMSGGPNTAVNIACRLAATGIKVRLVSTQAELDADTDRFWNHAAKLTGFDPRVYEIELIDASYRGRPFIVGPNDLFMATAWWTAQAVKYILRHMSHKRFLYLIQDYECLLHPASTQQALAYETYEMDYLPIVNTRLLYDFLVENRIGQFANERVTKEALVFEPAVDPQLFFPQSVTGDDRERKKRRLLFYARPVTALRNLFELGVAALRLLISENEMPSEDWEFLAMGEAIEPVRLSADCWLRPSPWKDLSTYAQQMRDSDVLLSPMLSPHPSYPPLEMAACGRAVVTTTFGNKDSVRLAAISSNIFGAAPTLEGIADALRQAMRHRGSPGRINLPVSWSESLDGIVAQLHDAILRLQGAPSRVLDYRGDPVSGVFPGFSTWPSDNYGVYRQTMLADRADYYVAADPALLSFITTVWDTKPQYLEELAETVFGQDSGQAFEWVILDNGSKQAETREALARIAENPVVRLYRVDENIGIVPGLRYVLERSSRRYVVPLDSDDLLTPDCVRVLTSALHGAGLPPVAYSDEDKVFEGRQRDPYSKPDWDPVLFTHSCYIAHLCAIERETAIRLGCYTNHSAEGSSDWDSFTRFLLAGIRPLHVPELIYTWRMHPQSTALNISSKSYIHESQLSVLRSFIIGRGLAERYSVEPSPLFGGTPDWRFVRGVDAPSHITTVLFGPNARSVELKPAFSGHQIERIVSGDLAALLEAAQRVAVQGHYMHLLSTGVVIDDDRWAQEALTMFEMYPGTAMVGGRIHKDGILIAADNYFGFDGHCSSPNLGRTLTDMGYFAQLFKPHAVSSVAVEHCVVSADFLVSALVPLVRAGAGMANLSAWLGAAARTQELRCVFSPYLSAAVQRPIEQPSSVEVAAFTIAYASLLPDSRLLSPRLGLTRRDAYRLVLRAERAEQERRVRVPPCLPYFQLHAAELMARRVLAQTPSSDDADLSLLTTIYVRTDPTYFRATADSLLQQTIAFREWVLLVKGPMNLAMEAVLQDLSQNKRVRILRREPDIGIIAGMRICLEEAVGRFVVPLDADDLLTVDALEILADALTARGGADFVFSDEDVIYDDVLQSPMRRGEFDPILNDADSTVWHLCGFSRELAMQLGVYTDVGAEACHDWDTMQRFGAVDVVIRHVPHVLYHWRHHPASTSGAGTVNQSTLESVRHVLAKVRARQATPDLYEIRPFPISRGAEQFALLRRKEVPLTLCLIYIVHDGQSAVVPEESLSMLPVQETRIVHADRDSGEVHVRDMEAGLKNVSSELVVLLDGRFHPSNEEGPWDAMRLFEMHADVVIVGGRILDARGCVVACGEVLSGREVTHTWIGRHRDDPGEYALALKPQTATAVAGSYFYCRTTFLRGALLASGTSGPRQWHTALAHVAHQQGSRLAYSPLVEARVNKWR